MIDNNTLLLIICGLIGAHYLSMIYEIRKVKQDVDDLRKDVTAGLTAGALAASNSAAAAAAAAAAVAAAAAAAAAAANQTP